MIRHAVWFASVLIFALWTPTLASSLPPLEWITTIDSGELSEVAVDSNGNVYWVGRFSETTDFDPGPGVFELEPIGEEDGFLVKLDPSGALVWVRQIGGTSFVRPDAVILDEASTLYVSGSFAETADFDPGPGSAPLIDDDIGSDAFVLKLNTDGDFVWVRGIHGESNAGARNLAVLDDELYVAGPFGGTHDFDPGPGTFELSVESGFATYVLALTTDGAFRWAVAIGQDPGNAILPEDIAAVDGFVYIGGVLFNSVDFDPGPGEFVLSPGGISEAYVAKYDDHGGFVWAGATTTGPGGDGDNVVTAVLGLEVADGSIYAVGPFSLDVDFDPGPGEELVDAGPLPTVDGFVWQLNEAGELLRVHVIDASVFSQVVLTDLHLDERGAIHTIGWFEDSVFFDPGSLLPVTAVGSYDGFVTEFDQDFGLNWVAILGGRGSLVMPEALAVRNGALHVAGEFFGAIDFDPGPGVVDVSSVGFDEFVLKLAPPKPVPAVTRLGALLLVGSLLLLAAALPRPG